MFWYGKGSPEGVFASVGVTLTEGASVGLAQEHVGSRLANAAMKATKKSKFLHNNLGLK